MFYNTIYFIKEIEVYLMKMGEDTSAEATLNFEFETTPNTFHLYERGGENYILIDGEKTDSQGIPLYIRKGINSFIKKLNLLYPVAIVGWTGNTGASIESALTKYIETFERGSDFKFIAKRIGFDDEIKGEVKLKGKAKTNKGGYYRILSIL